MKISQLLLLILIIPIVFLEVTFVKTFEKILAGNYAVIENWQLVVSAAAPLSSIFFFVCAYLVSISLANNVLKEVSLKYHPSDTSPLKVLVEDYNMALEGVLMPSILLIYRGTMITTLSITAMWSFPEIISVRNFIIFIIFVLIIVIIYAIVRRVAKSFSIAQDKRMRLMNQIIAEQHVNVETETFLKISRINYDVFCRKLIMGFFGFAVKPLIDFIIVVLVAIIVYNDDQNGLSMLAGVAVIGYRMAGPFLNLSSNINQINFGWASLSDTWRSLLRVPLRKSKF